MGIEVVVRVVNTQYVVFLIIWKGATSGSEKEIRMPVSFLGGSCGRDDSNGGSRVTAFRSAVAKMTISRFGKGYCQRLGRTTTTSECRLNDDGCYLTCLSFTHFSYVITLN